MVYYYYNPQGLWHCQVLYVIRQILTRDEIMGAHLGHAEIKHCTFIQENFVSPQPIPTLRANFPIII